MVLELLSCCFSSGLRLLSALAWLGCALWQGVVPLPSDSPGASRCFPDAGRFGWPHLLPVPHTAPVGWEAGCSLSLPGLVLSQSQLKDFVPSLYLLRAEAVSKMFSSPFLRAAPSHLLSGRNAELRATGAVCLHGARS